MATRHSRVCDSRKHTHHAPFDMVSSLLVEALSSPTDVLLSFYDSYDQGALHDFPHAVTKHFSDIFREESFSEVCNPHLSPCQWILTRQNTQDSSSDIVALIQRSRTCPISRLGPGHFLIARDLFVQVERWQMWGLGHDRDTPG